MCARNNSKTIFVDNENSFSPVRLSQIAGNDIDKISPFIILFNPLNFNEQSTLIENLELYINQRIVLIVFDTIISLYRNEFGLTEKIFALNRRLNRQLAFLSKIVKFYNVAILLTSQVRSNLQYNVNKKIEPIAHRLLRFWSQNIIRLEKTEKNGIRQAVLEKYDYERHFGGVYYLFVRGISDQGPEKRGIFFDRPKESLILALIECLTPPESVPCP